MQKKLNFKIALIVAVLLLCVYGIIGLPKSKEELIANWKQNIKLGLDLRGGSHLVLQVQVQDAFKAEADRPSSAEGRTAQGQRQLHGDRPQRPDHARGGRTHPDQHSRRAGERTGDFRAIVTERFPTWVLTPVNSTDYRLNMRPTEALALRRTPSNAASAPSRTASTRWD